MSPISPLTDGADGTDTDLDRIMAVMAAAFVPEFGEAWTRRQVENALMFGPCRYRLIMTPSPPCDARDTSDNNAAGFALLRRVVDEEELLLFAIAPPWRRRGLGRQLLGQVMDDAREGACQRMLLEMRRGNPAEALYRAAGFVPIGIRPRYYRTISGTRLDAITFACPLFSSFDPDGPRS